MTLPSESWLSSPRAQRWFLMGLVVLFVGISIQYSLKVMTPKRDGNTASAVLRWASQIQKMEEGEDVHRSHNYPNPPIMAMILAPIADLALYSPLLGALTWFYLKVLMAFACMWWVFRLVESPGYPFPVWAKMLTVVLTIRPIIGDLSHGNVNIFILFVVTASLVSFSKGRDLLAGICLALGIACKVTPALFVGYFLWKRAWRVLVGTGIGLVLFFVIVPSIWLGWDKNLQALQSWIEVMILPFVAGGVVTPEHNNQSLPGLVARLLTEAPSFSTYIADLYTPIRYQNVVDIGPVAANRLVKVALFGFLVLVMCCCRQPIQQNGQTKTEARQGWSLAAEYALIVLGMLLFSERTWKHHCVTLLLPFAVLCHALARLDLNQFRKRLAAGGIVAATLLMTSTSTGLFWDNPPKLHEIVEQTAVVAGPTTILGATHSGMLTDSPAKTAQVYGGYIWAFFCLIGTLTVLLSYPRKQVVFPLQTTIKCRAA